MKVDAPRLSHARNPCIDASPANGAIMRVARRFGIDMLRGTGEADAHRELRPASFASINREFVTDTQPGITLRSGRR